MEKRTDTADALRRDIRTRLVGLTFRVAHARFVEGEGFVAEFLTVATTDHFICEVCLRIRPAVMNSEEFDTKEARLLADLNGPDPDARRAAVRELKAMRRPPEGSESAVCGVRIVLTVEAPGRQTATVEAVTDSRGGAVFGGVAKTGTCTITEVGFSPLSPADVPAKRRLAEALEAEADALRRDDERDAALSAYLKSVESREAVLAATGEDGARLDLASALEKVGRFHYDIGRIDDCRALFGRALTLREAAVRAAPRDAALRLSLSRNLRTLYDLEMRLDRPEAARTYFDKVLQINDALAALV